MIKFRFQSAIFIGTLLTAVVCPPAQAQDTYELDNSHTSLIFSISHFNIGYIYGRFNTCSGTISMDKDTPSNSKFQFAIDTSSIDTNDEGRDKHVKGPDFFDAENHPKMEFTSESVTVVRGVYTVKGKMKIRDVEKEVTIPLQLLGVGKGPFGNIRMGMLGKFTIKRSDYGMDKMLEGIGDDVAITFSFEAIRK